MHASSGTTGRPTVVGYTRRDIDNWADLMARSIRAAGGRAGDVCHVAYGYGLFTGGLGAHYGAERLGCTVVPGLRRDDRAAGRPDPRLRRADHHGHAVVLPRHRGRDGCTWASILGTPRCGSGSSAPSRGPSRCAPRWRQRTGIHAVDIYGLSEVMGPGVAQECVETKDGLHIWEDHFYPEIIDPVTGEVLPDGRGRRARLHHADQGSLPGAALSHPRPDPAAAREPLAPGCAGWRRSPAGPTT